MPDPALSAANQIAWQAPASLEGVRLIAADRWVSDLGFYHEDSFDLCQFDHVTGTLGPVNRYQRWSARARPQDVLLFEPGHAHQARGGVEANFKVVMIPARRVQQAAAELGRTPSTPHFDNWIAPSLFAHVNAVHRVAADPEASEQLEEAFETLLVELLTTHAAKSLALESIDDATAALAREYIDDLLSQDPPGSLVLADLVRSVGARGKSQLIRDFEKVHGVAPYEYFKLRKFALARRLLTLAPPMKVQHIAWDLGYTAYSFARAFRELHGVTPREYQRSAR